MESVCGVLHPDWLSKGGPAIAAFTALFIYAMGRFHAWRDAKAKRERLFAMLRQHLLNALATIWAGRERLQRAPANLTFDDRGGIQMLFLGLKLQDVDRMIELQAELVQNGRKGDEAIVEFVEWCRRFDKPTQTR